MTRVPVSSSTRVAGVIGSPVRHSLSPTLYNAAFAAAGLDWVYVAFEVGADDVEEAFGGMKALGIVGLSVTTPHKDAAFRAADECSAAAGRMRAVNCLHWSEGRLLGHNTDGDGFVDSLHEADCDPSGLSFAVLGAGGAARSVIEALGRAGAAEVLVINALGRVFMGEMDCPFRAIDNEIAACKLGRDAQAIFVDFHAEATSEKQSMAFFLDGRVTAVVGTQIGRAHV